MERSHTVNKAFKCYFCNKTIKNETQLGHTTVCGSVLLQCPARCGSYVRRMDMSKHTKECQNRASRNGMRIISESELSETDASTDTVSSPSAHQNRQRVNCLVHEQPRSPRPISSFVPGKQSPRPMSSYVSGKQSPRPVSSYVSGKQSPSSVSLQEMSYYKNIQGYQQQQLESLKSQNTHLIEWRNSIQSQINMLQNHLSSVETFRKETNMQWMTTQQKFMQLEKIHLEIDHIKNDFIQEQNYIRKCLSGNRMDFGSFKDSVVQDIRTLKTSCADQCIRTESISMDVKQIEDSMGELKAKLASLVFDVRALSQIASEASEKLEIQEKVLREIKNDFGQIKSDIQCLEDMASSNQVVDCCSPGHLLWRITECDAKMEEAKTKGLVVKSPIFLTHHHGYKVRLLLYFNGLKKWKDRYALFCLHVVKGEYDMLLKWPCNIEGTVALRDLENLDEPKNFTKKITAKCHVAGEDSEDPQESSTSYIFIAHTTITKSKYMKEDTMFVDIKLDDSRHLFI